MNLLNTILVGLKEVWTHKFRSVLTMLGIILGVASLVGMAAVIKGMENGMKEAMIAMGGADKVLLQEEDVPSHQQHLADQAPGRTMVDVEALRRSAPLLRVVSPEMRVSGVVVTRGEKMAMPSELCGVWPAVIDMNLHTLAHGRFFTELDEENAHAVCVIGTGIRDELFGAPEDIGREIIPIGELVNLNGQPFTIVGMFAHYESEQEKKLRELARSKPPETRAGPPRRRGFGRGNWAFWHKNYTMYIPLNTAWIRFRAASGLDNIPDPRLSDIDLKVESIERVDVALQQARNVLMMTHRGIEDFSFRTQENNLESINKQIRNARLSGGFIAAISLLVGDRDREHHARKYQRAHPRDWNLQGRRRQRRGHLRPDSHRERRHRAVGRRVGRGGVVRPGGDPCRDQPVGQCAPHHASRHGHRRGFQRPGRRLGRPVPGTSSKAARLNPIQALRNE